MEKKNTFYFSIFLLNIFFCNIAFSQDVSFDWAIKVGGTGNDYSYSTTTDALGNVYTCGIFRGNADFGIYSLTSVGSANGFITKQDSDGNVLWAKQLTNTGHAQAYWITADDTGNLYATGAFLGVTTFDSHVLNPPTGNNRAMFVIKYDTSGTIVWIEQFNGGETGYGIGSGISLDAEGNVYTSGYFNDTIIIGTDTFTSMGGTMDGFITKQDVNGNVLWARQLGGLDDSYAYSVSIDELSNVYTAGFFNGTVDFENNTLTSAGENDLFITKHDSDGNIVWVRQVGGTGYDEAISVAVDASGDIYITGHFEDIATFGTHTFTSTGNRDGFIAKYDSDGNVIWAKQLGGTDVVFCKGITVDASGNVYTTGSFNGAATFDNYTYTTFGGLDLFVTGHDTDGNALWAKQFGGAEQDRGNSISVDANGNVVVTGDFHGAADFDPSDATYILTANGMNADVFVLKLNSSIVGINVQSINNGLEIYPNPANNFVIISNVQGNSNIKIIDVVGKIVYNGIVTGTQTTINTTGFVNGIYLLEIEYKGNITDNKKIVVNK